VTVSSERVFALFDNDQKKQVELGDRLDLSSYLLKPVQRMSKYALLLQQFVKDCHESHAEYADLTVRPVDNALQVLQTLCCVCINLVYHCHSSAF